MTNNITYLPRPEPLTEIQAAMIQYLREMSERVTSGLTQMVMLVELIEGEPQPYSTIIAETPMQPLQMLGYLELLKQEIVNSLMYDDDEDGE
jgi:hypothetical protein